MNYNTYKSMAVAITTVFLEIFNKESTFDTLVELDTLLTELSTDAMGLFIYNIDESTPEGFAGLIEMISLHPNKFKEDLEFWKVYNDHCVRMLKVMERLAPEDLKDIIIGSEDAQGCIEFSKNPGNYIK